MSPGVMEGFLPPAEVGDAIGDAAFAVNCAAILSASGRRRCGGHDRTRFIRAVLPAKLARWGLMLTGALAWSLYSYATMAVGAAFNQLFLVYVAPFSASLWAFMIAIRDIDITRLARAASAAATRPGGADARQRRGDRSDLARPDPGRAARGRSAAATGWLHDRGDHGDRRSRDRPGRFRGQPAHPAPFAFGYLMAFPLLLLEAMLAPMITAQTISQIAAGVSLSPGEMIGPVAGFVVLTGVAI